LKERIFFSEIATNFPADISISPDKIIKGLSDKGKGPLYHYLPAKERQEILGEVQFSNFFDQDSLSGQNLVETEDNYDAPTKQNIHDTVQEHVPKDVKTTLPGRNPQIRSNLPQKGDIQKEIPSPSDIENTVPNVDNSIPSPKKETTSHLPSQKQVKEIPTQKIENTVPSAGSVENEIPEEKEVESKVPVHKVEKRVSTGVDHTPNVEKIVDQQVPNSITPQVDTVAEAKEKKKFNACLQLFCNSQVGGLATENTDLMTCVQRSDTVAQASQCFKLHKSPAGQTLKTCLICKNCMPGSVDAATCVAFGKDVNDIRGSP